MDSLELRERWRDADEDRFVREEAFWEYWRRVAEAGIPVSTSELDEALTLPSLRVVDVLGLLAQHDLLPADSFQAARRFQSTLEDSAWLAAQLDARDMIRRLEAGGEPSPPEVCGALVAKGTAWAALEAVPMLRREQLDALIVASDQQRVFTRGQRHDLRLRANKR